MNRIKEIRKEKNIILKELARKTQLSIGYLSHLENGSRTNPSKETMEVVSNALGATVQEVFYSEEV